MTLYSSDNMYVVWVIGAILFLMAPFWFNPIAVFGKEEKGKIISVKIAERYNKDLITKAVKKVDIFEVTFEDEKGKIYILDLPRHTEKCFLVGDDIVSLNTFPIPISLTPHDNIACPYCGNVMPAVNKDCLGCGKYNIYRN